MVFYYAKKVKYLTKQEYELELKKIKEKNQQIKMKQNLKAAKVSRFNIPKNSYCSTSTQSTDHLFRRKSDYDIW